MHWYRSFARSSPAAGSFLPLFRLQGTQAIRKYHTKHDGVAAELCGPRSASSKLRELAHCQRSLYLSAKSPKDMELQKVLSWLVFHSATVSPSRRPAIYSSRRGSLSTAARVPLDYCAYMYRGVSVLGNAYKGCFCVR